MSAAGWGLSSACIRRDDETIDTHLLVLIGGLQERGKILELLRAGRAPAGVDDERVDAQAVTEHAEQALLRKLLRHRQLELKVRRHHLAEWRARLRQVARVAVDHRLAM